MTVEQFNKRVKGKKESFVILDDLVLDVTDYMEEHPGGSFLLEHTIGSDISKFFYGGYSLDGNLTTSDTVTHFHSNEARA